MKKYRLVYWNDFQDEYPATRIQDDDGDWYDEEDVTAALAAMNQLDRAFERADRAKGKT